MIKVLVPKNNINERKYILDIFFIEFLELNYKLILKDDCEKWIIELENGNKVFFEDHFFNRFRTDLEYLKIENIPKNINFAINRFVSGKNIPVIFGDLNIKEINISNSNKNIYSSIDIFASSFFMLTRWEEYVNKNRDEHNRFPATESLAYKCGFLDRAVVNEYVHMFRNILIDIGVEIKDKADIRDMVLTHDIDEIYYFSGVKNFIYKVLKNIKLGNISTAFNNVIDYGLIKLNIKKDKYDTFDWLMDISEKYNTKSRFYFMCGGITKYDNFFSIYSKDIKRHLKNIKKRDHIIGIHPSYNTYNNSEEFRKEKKTLEKVTGEKIIEGRQHYLRFEVPTTWQIWEDNGMEIDSTCGYADIEGFRCGIGEEYSVFNILTRKKLKLKERPLVIMDDTLFNYKKYDEEYAKVVVNNLIKNSSLLTILWHNSFISKNKFYKEILCLD